MPRLGSCQSPKKFEMGFHGLAESMRPAALPEAEARPAWVQGQGQGAGSGCRVQGQGAGCRVRVEASLVVEHHGGIAALWRGSGILDVQLCEKGKVEGLGGLISSSPGNSSVVYLVIQNRNLECGEQRCGFNTKHQRTKALLHLGSYRSPMPGPMVILWGWVFLMCEVPL